MKELEHPGIVQVCSAIVTMLLTLNYDDDDDDDNWIATPQLLDVVHADQKLYLVFEFLDKVSVRHHDYHHDCHHHCHDHDDHHDAQDLKKFMDDYAASRR